MKFLVLSACVAAAAAQGFYGLQSFPNGAVVPVDEPAVAAARADHLALKGAIAPVGYAAAPAVAYTGYNQLIAHPNGAVVPVDEPAVAAARADHLALKGAIAPVGYAAAPVAAAPAVAYSGYNA